MRKWICALAAVTMVTQSAQAQTLQDLTLDRSGEMRLSAGITIPLVQIRHKPLEKPRFDLSLAHRIRGTSDVQLVQRSFAEEEKLWRSTSFSLTLEDNPRLMMNGIGLTRLNPAANGEEKGGEKVGISDGLLIGGAAVLALVAASVLFATDVSDAIDDISNPD